MTYVITEPCIGTKDASCVEVCPVDCIYEGEDQYYIHPDECIDCGACEPECPVTAIFPDTDVPPEWTQYIEKKMRARRWERRARIVRVDGTIYSPAERIASTSDGSTGVDSPDGAVAMRPVFSLRWRVMRRLTAIAATATRLTPKVLIGPPALEVLGRPAAAGGLRRLHLPCPIA